METTIYLLIGAAFGSVIAWLVRTRLASEDLEAKLTPLRETSAQLRRIADADARTIHKLDAALRVAERESRERAERALLAEPASKEDASDLIDAAVAFREVPTREMRGAVRPRLKALPRKKTRKP